MSSKVTCSIRQQWSDVLYGRFYAYFFVHIPDRRRQAFLRLSNARKLMTECDKGPGPCLNMKTVFPGVGMTFLNIRRSWYHLIFTMGISVLVRWHLGSETVPWSPVETQHLSIFFNLMVCSIWAGCILIASVPFANSWCKLNYMYRYIYIYICIYIHIYTYICIYIHFRMSY